MIKNNVFVLKIKIYIYLKMEINVYLNVKIMRLKQNIIILAIIVENKLKLKENNVGASQDIYIIMMDKYVSNKRNK